MSTALKMQSCYNLQWMRQRFESLAEVAEEKPQAGVCTWLPVGSLLERQPLYLEKLGKPLALAATQVVPAGSKWKGLESDLIFVLVKRWGLGTRLPCRSKEGKHLDRKVDETVLQSAVLQWVQNKVKQALRKGVFTGKERQYEEPRLYNMIWEDYLCSSILNPERRLYS